MWTIPIISVKWNAIVQDERERELSCPSWKAVIEELIFWKGERDCELSVYAN